MSDNKTLKNLSDEDKKKIIEKVNTELTSVASEEKRTGQKIVLPDAERLVIGASRSLIECKKRAKELMLGMKKRELIRSVAAFLDLPQDGLPVMLKSDKEKLLFSLGQRAISDRYIILTHHINQQIMEERLKQQQDQSKKEETNVTETV